jgi:hypothetical protein
VNEVHEHEVPDLFHAVNERIREFEPVKAGGEYDFVCECLDDTCTEVMQLTWQEYESGHVEPGQFAVLPGHERERNDVVLRTERYFLVRQRALAAAG